ncbi:MAG: ferritin family protein [Deltaproteobacteria bacterium]|nr:ferritin family protein [Deltaproteobacteria bacterium]
MNLFEAGDILEFAIRIEENGENFYRYAVQIIKGEDTKKMFARLADEEGRHRKTFEELYAGLEKKDIPESYDGEYRAYLHDYVDNSIAFSRAALDRILLKVTDTLSAIDFAMRREMDSILYYSEIKQFVPAAQHPMIDKIIEEERRHFSILSEIRKKIGVKKSD